jgi:hypothetical protein
MVVSFRLHPAAIVTAQSPRVLSPLAGSGSLQWYDYANHQLCNAPCMVAHLVFSFAVMAGGMHVSAKPSAYGIPEA